MAVFIRRLILGKFTSRNSKKVSAKVTKITRRTFTKAAPFATPTHEIDIGNSNTSQFTTYFLMLTQHR